jgi:hypothetical protein
MLIDYGDSRGRIDYRLSKNLSTFKNFIDFQALTRAREAKKAQKPGA